jgi:hypothetical protein
MEQFYGIEVCSDNTGVDISDPPYYGKLHKNW